MKTAHYDESKVFNSEVYPLLEKAHSICHEHGISLVAYCQYGQEDDPGNADRTRASVAAMVNIEGDRTCPQMHAVAYAFSDPTKALLGMMKSALSRPQVVDQADDAAQQAGAKDAVDELLSKLGGTATPGNA